MSRSVKTEGHGDIRIGTLVNGSENTAEYIQQILPYGFESLAINFWQTNLKYDLKKMAREVSKVLKGTNVVISAVGVYGNPLETTPADLETVESWKRLIDSAELFGTDIVTGFAGRLRGKPINESIPRFKKVFGELAKRAKSKKVRIAFENCCMGGTWESGDWNIAHSPEAWKLMFEALPNDNLGLEWEPCHQMTKLIDPIPQIREWGSKIFHIHGKDATVDWDIIRKYGVKGSKPFVYHRTPGFGDSDWTRIISDLRLAGYKGSIDIEGWHDPVYRGELEMTGQVRGLNYLKECRGGEFVPNPTV